jgi:hypothetical protein
VCFVAVCSSRGFYLVTTAAEKPFALGKWVLSPEDDSRREERHRFLGGNAVDTEE